MGGVVLVATLTCVVIPGLCYVYPHRAKEGGNAINSTVLAICHCSNSCMRLLTGTQPNLCFCSADAAVPNKMQVKVHH